MLSEVVVVVVVHSSNPLSLSKSVSHFIKMFWHEYNGGKKEEGIKSLLFKQEIDFDNTSRLFCAQLFMTSL